MRNAGHNEGSVFSASFSSVAVTTAPNDLFGLLASTSPISRVEILSIDLSIISTVAPAASLASVQILRGSTAASGGAAITPANLRGWSGAPSAGSSVTAPSSVIASSASQAIIWAGGIKLTDGWSFPPEQELTGLVRPVIASGQRMHVRLTSLSSAVTMSGAMVFRELGAGLPS